MSDIAFSLITPIILAVFLGLYLDKKYSPTFPTWTITCSVIGIITGMWSVYKRYIIK